MQFRFFFSLSLALSLCLHMYQSLEGYKQSPVLSADPVTVIGNPTTQWQYKKKQKPTHTHTHLLQVYMKCATLASAWQSEAHLNVERQVFNIPLDGLTLNPCQWLLCVLPEKKQDTFFDNLRLPNSPRNTFLFWSEGYFLQKGFLCTNLRVGWKGLL